VNARTELSQLSPRELRALFRSGSLDTPTSGLAAGYVQANLVILPAVFAFDFLLFCLRNPKPCPLIEVLEAGRTEPAVARGADIRTDLPRYRVWEDGELAGEPSDIAALWRDDLVTFLLGCSFSFEAALLAAQVPVRHIEDGCNVPMFRTDRPCVQAGRFHGPMVVSMRPIPASLVEKATEISRGMPEAHGAPVHVGDPSALGIADISKPDYGDPVSLRDGDVPMFWACGVTPQAVAMTSRAPLVLTHSPGRMFLTDWRNEDCERNRFHAVPFGARDTT
jgi:uncharacterized protein YcsI (UPF0317 family)